ncbi:hypothetical protein EYF80_000286 [Liparis tanakae]|uniref:Uncharacterized protein n=1 Tax=Liparis tanakae TaxID=230148 RepID=A0A4Z2JIP0_9TELE|nr:hypothetical protein EYF80_000286 [Liparis tanakae]
MSMLMVALLERGGAPLSEATTVRVYPELASDFDLSSDRVDGEGAALVAVHDGVPHVIEGRPVEILGHHLGINRTIRIGEPSEAPRPERVHVPEISPLASVSRLAACTRSSCVPAATSSDTAAVYSRCSNTGGLSLMSRTEISTRHSEERRRAPRSLARAFSSYVDCTSRSRARSRLITPLCSSMEKEPSAELTSE